MSLVDRYVFGRPWSWSRPGAWTSRIRKTRDTTLAIWYAKRCGLPRFRYLDIGARWGPARPWQIAASRGLCDLLLVDADADEAARLRERFPQARVISEALSDVVGSRDLHLTAEPGKSSLLPPLESAIAADSGYRVSEKRVISTVRLDAVLTEPVDFVKIDVQGAERLVLEGFGALLDEVLGIQIEVSFRPTYAGQPDVGEMNTFLASRGFSIAALKPLSIARRGFADADAFYFRDGAPDNVQIMWRLLNGLPTHARLHHLM